MSDDILRQIEIPDAPAIPGLVFRHYRGEADLPGMVNVFNGIRVEDQFDGVATLAELTNQYQHLFNCNPYQDVVIVEVAGEMIGYGRCWWLQVIDGARLYLHFAHLLPKWRGQGIRTAMLRHNERRLRDIAAAQPPNGTRWLQSWASEMETHWQKVLQDAGYQIVRYELDMVRPDLEDIPNLPLPPGIEVRRGKLSEWRQIWEAAGEAFRDHWDEAEWSEEDFLQEGNAPTFNPDLWQVAWAGDEVAGGVLNFINAAENEEYGRQRGYTETVFVRRPWRRQGLAHALLARSFQVLKEAGMKEAALGVDAENTSGALKIYKDMGFQTVKQSAIYRKPLKIDQSSEQWQATIYAILPHPHEAKVWLEEAESGFALPHITMTGSFWDTNEAEVQRPLRQQIDPHIQVLYRASFQQDEMARTTESVFVLDNVGAEVSDGRWVDRYELQTITLKPAHKHLIETSLQEWESENTPVLRPSWAKRGWFAQAEQWISTALNQRGLTLNEPLEIVKNWSLSYVMRVKTNDGDYYFKTVASLPLFVNEAVMVAHLAQLFPQQVLTPLTIDRKRDWMLLPALPQIVRGGETIEQRQGFMRQFARMQITAVSQLETLLAAGCLDRRLDWLQTQIEPLFTAKICQADLESDEIADLIKIIPRLQDLCAELANTAVPQTLVHGDLHGGNVGIQNGEFVYFDWTDACISHPFFDMLDIFYEKDTAVQIQLRDAYLAEWTKYASLPDLLEIWAVAEVGAAIHHAISYWQIVDNIEPHAQGDLQEMIPFWLRKILALTNNLGAPNGR